MLSPEPAHLLAPLFTTDAMRATFSDQRRLQGMLDFEAALARALSRSGIAPASAAPAITSQCRAELFSVEALSREAALAGNPAIPLVKHLTALVAKSDEKAATFVHWGATSQDAIDTGLVLQLRDALAQFDSGLAKLSDALAQLVSARASTVAAGRTLLQQALPVTLGLKAAGWLDAVERHRSRLRETAARAVVLQFGGAVGTLAALGDKGPAVAATLADELKLPPPRIPWHAHRDRFAEVAATLGLLVGSLGKIARDISLLSQTEVAEFNEPAAPGRGGSSTMPHKRNPVGSAVILAAALRVPALVSTMLAAMPQEHERGLGGWHAEWETLPEIFLLSAGALSHATEIVAGLEIHDENIARNLGLTHGLILAEAIAFVLAKKIGRAPAHELLEQACRRALKESRPLRDILLEDSTVRAHLSAADLERLLDPKNYIGSAEKFARDVLSARAHKP